MKKIKIAFIISNLGQGGAENQFVKLITNLDKSRFDVKVLLYAAQTKPFFEEELIYSKIETNKHKLKNRIIPLKILEALIVINRFLKETQFDIVVTSLFMNNLFVRLAAPSFYGNRIITNMRTSIQNYSSFYRFCEKLLINKSYIVFNSKKSLSEFKSFIPNKYHKRLHLIYNGYAIVEKFIKSSKHDVVFGSLGRMSKEKNILQTVRVFQKFEIDNSDYSLIIQCHFGNQYEAIKNCIVSRNIEIRKKKTDIEVFYDSIDILILPSIFEGCPNVLFEALLRRKICIVSEGANSDDFIKDGVNGFVYDGTDQGLHSTMLIVSKLIKNYSANEIIENGYNYASNNFSINQMVNKYENLFDTINGKA